MSTVLDTDMSEERTDTPSGEGAGRKKKWPRHERGGFMWGLRGPQFLVVVLVILSIVGLLMLQQMLMAALWAVVAIPIGVVGAITWKGRPLMYRLWDKTKKRVRMALGETRWRTSEAPVAAGSLNLPGDVGARLSVHSTKWGGGLYYDARAQRATAVLKCESQGWDSASDADRSSRGRGFVKVCRLIARSTSVERVATMARTIPSETTAARQAHRQAVRDRKVEDGWGEDVMASVLTGREFVDGEGKLRGPEDQQVAVSRDTLVVISVSVPRAQKQIRPTAAGCRALPRCSPRRLADSVNGSRSAE